ncbi:CP family cyanate transporter-like MFS transporter [Phyllobacterium trifolii]|uniref:CP family cyanate transporter-like MFS transporter n=1 Tax=Phyllobacterium trifolii TaxID=300193 RepID=A0A839UDC1_9HYPH|nr:MFS transporter [Phyllobacterium trifolii]MBB3148517.1 CP family cyanate transporter-like MFS transporter [Phyllobacterium trifolii]
MAIGGIVLVALSLRPSIVSVGPVLPRVIFDFNLTHAQASLLTAIPELLMGLLALVAPLIARRLGRDGVILAALIILGVATLARACVTDIALLLATTAGVGAGIAIAGALIAGFIKERFSGHAAAVMGVYATALSVGSTVAAAATGPLSVLAGGWRIAIGVWSVLALIGAVAWLAVALVGNKFSTSGMAPSVVHRLPIRSGKAWKIAIFFAMNNLLFYSILAWLPSVYQEAGRSASGASFILASFTFAFMCANPIFGFLSRSHDRRPWLFSAGLMAFVGMAVIGLAPNALPLFFVPLCAFGLGGTFTLGMTLPLDNTSTADEANSWNAFVLLIGYVIAAIGPLASGYLRDETGDFEMSLLVLAGCAALMTFLAPFLKPRQL